MGDQNHEQTEDGFVRSGQSVPSSHPSQSVNARSLDLAGHDASDRDNSSKDSLYTDNEAVSAGGSAPSHDMAARAPLGGTGPCPIDYAFLDRYTGGDNQIRQDVLRIFRSQARLWLAEFDPALPDVSWYALSHSLKGSARGIGAFALADLAETAEAMDHGSQGKEACLAARTAILEDIAEALDEVQAEIDRIAA